MVRRAVRCLLVATVTVSFGISPARAAVLDLDRVPTRPPAIEVLGASAAGVLYRVSPADGASADRTTYVKPAGAAAYVVPGNFERLAGTRIFSYDGGSTVAYQVIGSPVTKPCTVPGELAAVTSYGWVTSEGDRVEIGANGCQVTAHLTRAWKIVAADETGYVEVVDVDQSGTKSLTYRSYADQTHPRVIPDGGNNWWISGLTLSGSAISWTSLERTTPAKRSFVVRAKTDGSAPVRLATIDSIVRSTSIAGGATGWAACDNDGGNTCLGGSFDANNTAHRLPLTQTVVSDGTRFVFDTHGSPDAVDAAAAVDATAARTRIAAVPYLPPLAYAVSLGAGGVAYLDSQVTAPSVNRRAYTKSGTTITLASQVRIAQSGSRWQQFLSRDGRRTAYVDNGGDLWLTTDDGVKTRVFDGETKTAIPAVSIELSGSRLLWWKALYDGEACDLAACFPVYKPAVPMIYNLATGTSSARTGPVPTKPASLWGSYLSYADNANAIWRRDLSSNALIQVKTAGGPDVNNVAVHDDYVAWSTCVSGTSNYCAPSTVAFRNMATQAAALKINTTSTLHISLSGGHVLFDDYVGNFPETGTLKVLRLGTTATGVVGPVKAHTLFDVHDETLAWVAPDDVARIAPNSTFVAPPRFLGNAVGPTSFTPSAGSWVPEFSISKALTTCNLTIRSGTTVRRVLTCPTTTGSARPGWNGLDSAGHLVPKGTYTWTLTGSDSDGTLRWWTNATHPISGTIRVT